MQGTLYFPLFSLSVPIGYNNFIAHKLFNPIVHLTRLRYSSAKIPLRHCYPGGHLLHPGAAPLCSSQRRCSQDCVQRLRHPPVLVLCNLGGVPRMEVHVCSMETFFKKKFLRSILALKA